MPPGFGGPTSGTSNLGFFEEEGNSETSGSSGFSAIYIFQKDKMSDKEIEMTKGISNETVCNYFYAVFIIVSILAGIGLINDLFVASRVRPSIGIPIALRAIVVLTLAVANTLFLYIMCARSLLK